MMAWGGIQGFFAAWMTNERGSSRKLGRSAKNAGGFYNPLMSRQGRLHKVLHHLPSCMSGARIVV